MNAAGLILYLDGASGGTAKNNWAGGVAEGMHEAGYKDAGEMVSWETGEGFLASGRRVCGNCRALRGKAINIPSSGDYRKDGDRGHHFDNVKKAFIRDHVAQYFPTREVPSAQDSTGQLSPSAVARSGWENLATQIFEQGYTG